MKVVSARGLKVLILLFLTTTLQAEDQPANTSPPAAAVTSAKDEAHAGHAVKATEVTAPREKMLQRDGVIKEQATASLGLEITVSVAPADFEKFENLQKGATEEKPLTLYLNCVPMKLAPIAICYNKDQHPEQVRFALLRTADNEMQWRALLRSLEDRDVTVAVGLMGEPKGALQAGKFRLRIVADWAWFWVAIFIIALLTSVIFVFGSNTNLLRDLSPHQESEFKQTSMLAGRVGLSRRNPNGLNRPPFSLGRVQMAFWFLLVAAAYLFLWLVLGEENSFNTTALTLLGISVSTGLISRTIDAGKTNAIGDIQAEREKLTIRQAELTALPQANLTDAQRTELTKIQGRLAEIERQLANQTVPLAEHTSEGFLTDILSDQNGISLHRLQMVGWTVILGLIFAAGVRHNLTMPTFDNTLLGLMGISSGAFLGFKLPETKTVPSAQ